MKNISGVTNIIHIGSFDRNVGDNLALDHVQEHLAAVLGGVVRFHLVDMSVWFSKQRNNVTHSAQLFKYSIEHHGVRAIVIGGGG